MKLVAVNEGTGDYIFNLEEEEEKALKDRYGLNYQEVLNNELNNMVKDTDKMKEFLMNHKDEISIVPEEEYMKFKVVTNKQPESCKGCYFYRDRYIKEGNNYKLVKRCTFACDHEEDLFGMCPLSVDKEYFG